MRIVVNAIDTDEEFTVRRSRQSGPQLGDLCIGDFDLHGSVLNAIREIAGKSWDAKAKGYCYGTAYAIWQEQGRTLVALAVAGKYAEFRAKNLIDAADAVLCNLGE